MTDRLNVALIYGSTRQGRFCDTIARWAEARILALEDYRLDVIDPDALALPARHEQRPGAAMQALRGRIDAADAFVVVTPEYNHSYPASLKFVIDAFRREWHGKPVAFVAYGGVSGGLRAVEHLRQVFAELHAVAIRDTVSIANPWERFTPDGSLTDAAPTEEAMKQMMIHLHWWADTLRANRHTAPFLTAS